jgi:hypothetical protein
MGWASALDEKLSRVPGQSLVVNFEAVRSVYVFVDLNARIRPVYQASGDSHGIEKGAGGDAPEL